MNKETFTIPNISCSHCVNAVKNELLEHKDIVAVEGDAATKTISVEFDDSLSVEAVKTILAEINYPVQ